MFRPLLSINFPPHQPQRDSYLSKDLTNHINSINNSQLCIINHTSKIYRLLTSRNNIYQSSERVEDITVWENYVKHLLLVSFLRKLKLHHNDNNSNQGVSLDVRSKIPYNHLGTGLTFKSWGKPWSPLAHIPELSRVLPYVLSSLR